MIRRAAGWPIGHPLSTGTVVAGRYEILSLLGSGGAADAYLARDRLLMREVALKLVRADSGERLEGLRHEFGLLRELCHPHLVEVLDFGRFRAQGGRHSGAYYTANVVPGRSLAEVLRSGDPPPWTSLRQVLTDALDALRCLHSTGLRHGDFTPANVMARPDWRGVLIDLSCGSQFDASPAGVSGTPGYLAPEVLKGQPPDHRSDLYSVGVTLGAILDCVGAEVEQTFRPLVRRLTASEPAQRGAHVDEVLEALGVDPATLPPVPLGLGTFVGRSRELGLLRGILDDLVGARPGARVAMVEGAEGIGKTRLLEELRWEALGKCTALETNTSLPGAIPQLLATALGVDSVPEDLDSVLGAWDRLQQSLEAPLMLLIDDADRLSDAQLQILRALVRSLGAPGRLAVVISCTEPLTPPLEEGLRLVLAPLPSTDVEGWLGRSLPSTTVNDLWQLSGGHPKALRSLLDEFVGGTIDAEQLHDGTAAIRLSSQRRARAGALSPAAQQALGIIALVVPSLSDLALGAWRVSEDTQRELVVQGLATADRCGLRLARPGEARELVAALDPRLIQGLHRGIASWIGELQRTTEPNRRRQAELAAIEIEHLALAGQAALAATRLGDTEPLQDTAPRAWRRAVSALRGVEGGPNLQLALARLERSTGAVRESEQRLRRLLTEPIEPELDAEVRIELSAARVELGQVAEAEQELGRVGDSGAPSSSRATSALAQSLLKRGRYREAASTAERGLAYGAEPKTKAMLLLTLGLAQSFMGSPRLAQERLNQAAELVEAIDSPRGVVRLRGAQAIVAYELGELSEAARHHTDALTLAERHGLVDQLATALLNLGTVHHQRGDWGAALPIYERGQRIAIALGQTRTLALMRFNLAKLYLDLGQTERAARAAELCRQQARAASLPLVAAEAQSLSGELALLENDCEAARGHFTAARKVAVEHASARECLELDLHLAETELLAGNLDAAAVGVQECGAKAEEAHADDVRIHCRLVEGRLASARGQPQHASHVLEEVTVQAERAGLGDLQAQAELALSEALSVLGSTTLAQKHRQAARMLWERTAASLSPTLRQAFWQHPRRLPVALPTAEPQHRASRREQRLELLLDVNKRLNSSLSAEAVLERAIDAALELTGAERGFVLVTEPTMSPNDLRVAVARRLDRATLEPPAGTLLPIGTGTPAEDHGRFSRAIAESVVRGGAPVVTSNALEDERFRRQKSVHALRLKSVVCVPVASPDKILGALYLDSQLAQRGFDDEDVRLLTAFADQVALALRNARLHDALAQRNRELSRERRRVEELVRSQAAEIARLAQEVEERRRILEHRYDYGCLIGSSPAMQRVFALLDRVIETDLSVLIEGESGTGKELVARAIHTNDARRQGPLVSLNCAAVPENLLESELFGYERGAYTGADRSREGLILQSSGGTLFLDELGEMPSAMQTRLLRVIQERELRPLGSDREIPIDLRLVCATNRRLRDEVAAGRFREDLYYRISGVEITLPPLRQRREDIPALVHHFLTRAASRADRPVPELTRQALEALTHGSWPGNVRELEHVVTRAVVLSDGGRLTAKDFEVPQQTQPELAVDRQGFERQEAARIAAALSANRFNVSKVARILEIPRATLWRKMKRYGLNR